MIDALTQPFAEFAFMRRALIGCFALSLSAPPIGVFLVLRRMSLMGDVMGHAILPGAAIGFLLAGLSLFAMSVGAFASGLAVALAAGLGGAHHHPARGRKPCRLLSGVARAWRADRLDAGQQCRSAACAVRHRACARRRGHSASRRHRHGLAGDARRHLPAARARMFRPAIPALGQQSELAHPSHLPGAGGAESRGRLPGARHADGGRHHAAAGGRRALLGCRRVRHDPGGHGWRLRRERHRAAALLLRQPAHRPGDHSALRRVLSRVDAGGRRKVVSSGAYSRASIWKPDLQLKEFVS